MSTQELRKYKKAIEDKKTEISNDKEKAREFLYTIGVLTKGGNLRKEYRELCILKKQA
ncbi:hypothetical protein [Flavobacterium collinsii]|uniref:hypothetical protein n=1 Tax=Flavobacterium collinsii TaxID=1114861 RepID=UPI0021E005BC|nr:hypothetical protein [Flavobacterium collinsii]